MSPSTKASKRHVPLRSCVNCGNRTAKGELIRIVATPQGRVEIDPTGKLPGRGAYLCADGKCVQASLKRGRIDYALRTKLKDEEWAKVASLISAPGSAE